MGTTAYFGFTGRQLAILCLGFAALWVSASAGARPPIHPKPFKAQIGIINKSAPHGAVVKDIWAYKPQVAFHNGLLYLWLHIQAKTGHLPHVLKRHGRATIHMPVKKGKDQVVVKGPFWPVKLGKKSSVPKGQHLVLQVKSLALVSPQREEAHGRKPNSHILHLTHPRLYRGSKKTYKETVKMIERRAALRAREMDNRALKWAQNIRSRALKQERAIIAQAYKRADRIIERALKWSEKLKKRAPHQARHGHPKPSQGAVYEHIHPGPLVTIHPGPAIKVRPGPPV